MMEQVQQNQKTIIKEAKQKADHFFGSEKTFSYHFRMEQLNNFQATILKHTKDIEQALKADLNKSEFESYMCETGLVLDEIKYLKKHLKKWMKPVRKIAGITQQPGYLKVHYNPYGTVLIMSPWNYPILLTLSPVAGAIAAGNTCVIKPSAYAPHTANMIRTICQEAFPEGLCEVILGGRTENQALLEENFDYIFFTGSPTVGKLVMKHAADTLTPLTLELGGKSPCIIDTNVDLKQVAKRLAFAKFINAGQTCVAPDYVLAVDSIKNEFISCLSEEFSDICKDSEYFRTNFPSIINEKHFDRLSHILNETPPTIGGKLHPESRQIEPALIIDPALDSEVMTEEIFGPVLPVLSVSSWQDAAAFIKERPHPLALYLFTNSKEVMSYYEDKVLFGGGCINDALIHLSSPKAPFGGVGNSGMGQYHGRDSFITFSHPKTIVKKAWFGDLALRYHPYTEKKNSFLRKILG